MRTLLRREAGFTMILALLMLILMTAVALTALKLGKDSLQIVDNLQQYKSGQAAAQEALDRTISGTLFTTSPSATLSSASTPCPSGISVANGICVDVNGDGKTVFQVQLSPAPVCVASATIPTNHLDITKPDDQGCILSNPTQFGIVPQTGTTTGNSLCASTIWELNAVAQEPTSLTSEVVTEGVSIRVSTDSVATYCP